MKIIMWNVRGINDPNKRVHIKHQIDACREDIVLLQASKLSQENFDSIIKKWVRSNFCFLVAQGAYSGLVALWNSKTMLVEASTNNQKWELLKVSHFYLSFYLYNIYVPNSTPGKKQLWEELNQSLYQLDFEKVILAEDFNAIINLSDKKGGIIPLVTPLLFVLC